MEQQIKVTKRTPAQPKVKYNGKAYIVMECAGNTIRISDGAEEFCIHKDNVTASNREAKAMLGV